MKIFPGMLAAGLLASTLYACQTQVGLVAVPFPPPAPSNLAARSVSSSRLDLSWNDNAFGPFNETGFELQYATNAGFAGATTLNLGKDSTSVSLFGLGPIMTYYIRIKAEGAGGSAWSNTALGTTAPNFVVATEVTSSGIDVNTIKVEWTPTSSKNFNINGYTVRYSTAAGSCNDRAVTGRTSSTYLATGLVPSKTYEVSVRAGGSGHSSAFPAPAVATTLPDGLGAKTKRISPVFFGQNAWLPLRIGTVDQDGDLEKLLCGASYAPGGRCVPAEVQASGVKLMRYGGRTVDNNYDAHESPAQYLTMVDNMRTNGIEPLLEVPYGDSGYSATDAADLVRYINITHDRCVRYWTIANEPNEYAINNSATNIADNFKAYAIAMRDVDPTIVIVGPDLSYYDEGIMNELTTPGGPNDICGSYQDAAGNPHYYLDVIDFHNYPFSGLDPMTAVEDLDQTRANIIAYPQGGFQSKIESMKDHVGQCNRLGTLKMAVTEINIEYRNPADKTLSGVSAQSFLAGQYWADVMNVGMKNGLEFIAFWSVKEGDPLRELGYIKNDDDYTKLPTYYHYQMLAQNFRGVYAPATSVKVKGVDAPNVKAFGAKDLDQIVVMLLNENQGTLPLTYTVRLDTAPVIPLGNFPPLKVNIDAGVRAQYSSLGVVDGALAAESTVMLVFDEDGVLLERHVYGLSSGTAGPTEHNN